MKNIQLIAVTDSTLSLHSYNDYKRYGTYVYVDNLKQEASHTVDKLGEKVEQGASQLPEIIKQIVDKLTGKDMEVTYDFQNLEIDVPRVAGPDGKELGSAKWKVNGKFVLSTALLDTNSSELNER